MKVVRSTSIPLQAWHFDLLATCLALSCLGTLLNVPFPEECNCWNIQSLLLARSDIASEERDRSTLKADSQIATRLTGDKTAMREVTMHA
jgi:hypothetical protein